MTKPKSITLSLLASLLAGCAFSGGPVGSPPPPTQPSEAGTLTIYRSNSPIGLFGTMHVALDEHDIYRLGMGQSYSMRLDPGHYFLNYSIGLNLCGGMIEIEPRKTLLVRLLPNCVLQEI